MAEYSYTDPTTTVPDDGILIPKKEKEGADSFLPLDRQWARGAFLIGEQAYDPSDEKTIRNRYWSSVNLEFTDTRIGGNIGVNPKPQFCPYSDIVAPDRLGVRNPVNPSSSRGNYGKGRYYGEAIDRPAQRIFIRAGFPQFTGLVSYLARAYDARMTEMATTGRGKGLLYEIPKAFGTYLGIKRFPPIAILSLGVQAISFVTSMPSSKFYTLKPSMHTYWSAVNNLVFAWMINRGVWPKTWDKAATENQRLGMPFTIDQSEMDQLRTMMPDIFLGENNYVDVFAVATRAQRIANHVFLEEYRRLEEGDMTALDGFLEKRDKTIKTYLGTYTAGHNNTEKNDWSFNLTAHINKWLSNEYWESRSKVGEDGKQTSGEVEKDIRDIESGDYPDKEGLVTKIRLAMDAQIRQGGEFVCFIVENTGQAAEGWSNSYAETSISQSINSSVKQVRDMRFTLADGNVIGGVVGEVGGAVVNSVKDVVEGGLSGITLGIYDLVKGLAGSGFLDIPKAWESSQVKLTEGNYKIKLFSPEPDVYSQLQNIYIPLFCAMALVMPLSVGKSAYRGPMICEVYDRGRFQSRLAACVQLDISRGTSTLPFTITGQAIAIDMNLKFIDLSSIMHMPLSAAGISQYIESTMDEDNLLMDYLAVLAGQDIYSQIYTLPKAMINLAKMTVSFQSLFSPYRMASAFNNNSIIGGFLENFVAGSSSIAGATQPGR